MNFTPHKKAVLTFEDILCESNSARRVRADAVEQFGERAVAWAEIYEALAERAEQPTRLSVPRRVFISYRWGTNAQNRWVEVLAEKLKARGNVVVFDRDVARESPGISVARLVALIADCSLFLMVVDPGYIERVCSSDPNSRLSRSGGWAWDEYALWRTLVNELRLPGLALLREGAEIPRNTTLIVDGGMGNIADVREEGSLDAVLDAHFCQLGPIPELATARQAALLLHQSVLQSKRGDFLRAWELAYAAVRLIPDISDGYVRLTTASLILGRSELGLAAARKALAIDEQHMLFYFLAGAAACSAGEYAEAVRTVAAIATTDATSWRPHLILAHALAESGQLGSARAHRDLAFANHTELRRALKLLHRRSNAKAIARAREMFDQRGEIRILEPFIRPKEQGFFTTYLAPAPELPQRVHAIDIDVALLLSASRSEALMRLDKHVDEWHITCTACHIGIRIEDDFLCMLCGAQHGGNLRPCAYCGSGELAPSQVVAYGGRCPFCHAGTLSTGD
jgi:hypothetical protein